MCWKQRNFPISPSISLVSHLYDVCMVNNTNSRLYFACPIPSSHARWEQSTEPSSRRRQGVHDHHECLQRRSTMHGHHGNGKRRMFHGKKCGEKTLLTVWLMYADKRKLEGKDFALYSHLPRIRLGPQHLWVCLTHATYYTKQYAKVVLSSSCHYHYEKW